MPHFHIRRVVGDISQDDVDAAAIRSLWCLVNFPNLKWLRSTWDAERGELHCLYESPDVATIREHARSAQIPCDEVREVTIVDPADYVGGVAIAPASVPVST